MLYRYINRNGDYCYSEEHMLYPIEIAKLYGIYDIGFNGPTVKKAILDYLEESGIKEQYYYNGRWGKIRCFPKWQYHPAVMRLIGGNRMTELTNKTCPHCGAAMFLGTYVIPVVVGVKDTENPDERYDILKKNEKGATVNIIKCARCKADITEEELVASVLCKECGRPVLPDDVDENGVCDVCRAKKERADLANASNEELIHRLLQLEAMNSRTVKFVTDARKIAEDNDLGKNLMNPPEPMEDTNPDAVKAEEPKKTTRKRKVKKAEAVTEETPAETAAETDTQEEAAEVPAETSEPEQTGAHVVAPEEAQTAADDIANSQEAPFPDVAAMPAFDEQSPLPVQEPVPEDNAVGVGAGFQMFDNQDAPAF